MGVGGGTMKKRPNLKINIRYCVTNPKQGTMEELTLDPSLTVKRWKVDIIVYECSIDIACRNAI